MHKESITVITIKWLKSIEGLIATIKLIAKGLTATKVLIDKGLRKQVEDGRIKEVAILINLINDVN